MPSTIRDVARAAGVSVTTAHRALNGKAELSADKRARILAAARDLNYVPSAVARALVSGKTNTIGMIVTDNASPVYAGIVRGVEEVANGAGFGLLLCNSADSQDRALACLETLRAKQVDGVLITPVQTDRRDVARLAEIGLPFVLLLRHFADLDADWVVTDNEAGGYAATTHLLDLGHRRIGHLGGPAFVSSAQGRLAGYRRALAERGAPYEESLVVHAPFTVADAYDAAFALLDRADRPTAVFAANDMQAVGVMKAARALALRIPDDFALVGGDDIELAEFLEVPLTTFHQQAREIGSLGAQILLDRLRGEFAEPRRIVLKPELIVRRSSGGPR
jgi:LacI family transcriptional regulator